jgi:pimeloyl-ACP methyl ester carboxylesterase
VLRAAFTRLPLGTLHRRSLGRYLKKGCFDTAQLDRYVGWMDAPAGRRWLAHFFAGYRVAVRPELAAGLAGIRAPTAIIWGDRDAFCPLRNATELADTIPHATLHRLAGADHYVMEERPAEVTAALLAWLAR